MKHEGAFPPPRWRRFCPHLHYTPCKFLDFCPFGNVFCPLQCPPLKKRTNSGAATALEICEGLNFYIMNITTLRSTCIVRDLLHRLPSYTISTLFCDVYTVSNFCTLFLTISWAYFLGMHHWSVLIIWCNKNNSSVTNDMNYEIFLFYFDF